MVRAGNDQQKQPEKMAQVSLTANMGFLFKVSSSC
jgi:hypothetical protein